MASRKVRLDREWMQGEIPAESPRMKLPSRRRTIWLLVLIVAILGQVGFYVQDYMRPWGWRVRQVWDEARLIRSADLSMGGQAARIVDFVNEQVPGDAALILPPEGEPVRFALERSMQYFFFPREVVGCREGDIEACGERLDPGRTFALATEEQRQQADLGGKLVPAPDGLGWLAGIIGPDFGGPGVPEYAIGSVGKALAGDLAVLLAMAVLGALAIGAIGAKVHRLEYIGLSIPVGGGILTASLFVLSWAGVPLSPWTAGGLFGILAVVSAAAVRRRGSWSSIREAVGAFELPSLPELLLLGSGLALLAMNAAMSLGTSYRLFDPVQIWSVKGYGIGHEGSIMAAERWGVHGLAYPLNLPMQISLFYQMNGDLLPGSKLLYPLFGLGLSVALYGYLRRQRVDSTLAGLGTLLIASLPIVGFHATSGFANLPYTLYLIAGTLWTADGARLGRSRDQLFGSLLLGLAAWTRPEGVVFCAAIVGIASVFAWRKPDWEYRWTSTIPLLLIVGVWYLFTLTGAHFAGSIIHDAVDVASGDASTQLVDLGPLLTLFRVFGYSMFVPYLAQFPAISSTNWGLLFPIVLFLLVWRGRDLSPKQNPTGFLLAFLTAGVGLTTVGLYYLPSYSMGNYVAFIERAFPRAFLPTAILMTLLALLQLSRWLRTQDPETAADFG